MLRHIWIVFIALTLSSSAFAQDWDDGAPDADWLFESGYELEGVATQPGFYRQRTRQERQGRNTFYMSHQLP